MHVLHVVMITMDTETSAVHIFSFYWTHVYGKTLGIVSDFDRFWDSFELIISRVRNGTNNVGCISCSINIVCTFGTVLSHVLTGGVCVADTNDDPEGD